MTKSQLKNKIKEILREETMTGPGYTKPRRKPPTITIYQDELWGDNKTPEDAAKALQRKKIASMKERPRYTTTEEEDLEEMNSTASVGGEYMTPMAFNPKQKKKKIKEGKDKYKKLWKHKKTIKALYDKGWAPEDIADKLNIPDRYLKDVLRMGEQKENIKESLDTQDVQQVRKIVKEIINNMFRDIWLKRNSWNRI